MMGAARILCFAISLLLTPLCEGQDLQVTKDTIGIAFSSKVNVTAGNTAFIHQTGTTTFLVSGGSNLEDHGALFEKSENGWVARSFQEDLQIHGMRNWTSLSAESFLVAANGEAGDNPDSRNWKDYVWKGQILGDGTLSWSKTNNQEAYYHDISNPVDLNGDGRDDYLSNGMANQQAIVFFQMEDGSFQPQDPTLYPGTVAIFEDQEVLRDIWGPHAANLFGDEREEIILEAVPGNQYENDSLRIYTYNDQSGKYGLATTINRNDDDYSAHFGKILTFDFDNDGDIDILQKGMMMENNEPGRDIIEAYINNGDRSFYKVWTHSFNQDFIYSIRLIEDVDQDGFQDFVLEGLGGGVGFRVFGCIGDEAYGAPSGYETCASRYPEVQERMRQENGSAADYVAWNSGVRIENLVFFGQGDGSFQRMQKEILVHDVVPDAWMTPYVDNGELVFLAVRRFCSDNSDCPPTRGEFPHAFQEIRITGLDQSGNMRPSATAQKISSPGNNTEGGADAMVGTQLSFLVSESWDWNNDALTFSWDFGDGATDSGETVSHTYTAAGEYTVVLTASDGVLTGTDSLTVSIASGVDTESFELPETFVLKAAYPNPFNPTTTITYGLPTAAEVRITATDLLGRQVAVLVAGDMKAAGYHTVQFNADGLASGTYLIRMEAGDFVATQQVVLLK